MGAYIEFSKGVKVEARVTSSYISVEQAELTLNTELGRFTCLEDTKRNAFQEWNNLFNRILVEGAVRNKKPHSIPVCLEPTCFLINFMKKRVMEVLTTIVRMTEKYILAICIRTMVSGIRFVHNFL